jgi:hypothetical protein
LTGRQSSPVTSVRTTAIDSDTALCYPHVVNSGVLLVASLLLSMATFQVSAADLKKPTEVVVIGTFHNPTSKFQVARLREALKALALDLPLRPGPIEERKEVNGWGS